MQDDFRIQLFYSKRFVKHSEMLNLVFINVHLCYYNLERLIISVIIVVKTLTTIITEIIRAPLAIDLSVLLGQMSTVSDVKFKEDWKLFGL